MTSLCTHSATLFRVSSSVSALPIFLQRRLALSLAIVIPLCLGGCSSCAASPRGEDRRGERSTGMSAEVAPETAEEQVALQESVTCWARLASMSSALCGCE